MINKVILLGNVGMEPEARVFENGNKIVRFSLATTESIFNPSTNVRSEHTEWHNIIITQRHANFVEMYVKKGAQVYIEGRIRRREWGEEDNKRYSFEIRADEIKILGRRSENSPTGSAPVSGDNGMENQATTPAPSAAPAPSAPSNSAVDAPIYAQPTNQYIAKESAIEPSASETADDLPF